jgi:hypothetical protein
MIADYFPFGIENANKMLYIRRKLLIINSGNNFGVDFGEDLTAFSKFVTENRESLKKQGLMRVVQVPTNLVEDLQECCFSRNGYFVNLIAGQIMQSARIYRG